VSFCSRGVAVATVLIDVVVMLSGCKALNISRAGGSLSLLAMISVGSLWAS